VDEPQNKSPEVERDEHGRITKGTPNPGGRPKKLKEFRAKLEQEFYEEAFAVMRECLASSDGKVRIAALKELWDRMWGKAPQAVTNEDGTPLRMGLIFLPPIKPDDAG